MATNDVLWAEKYRPQNFDSLLFNTSQTRRLKKLVESDDFPHLLFYGRSGAGKRTLIKSVLNELFGAGVEIMKSEIKEFKPTSSSLVVDCVVNSSQYHQEVTPSEVDRYDRVVVNSIIKEIAGSAKLNVDAENEDEEKTKNFKVLVIHDLDKLSREAQSGLRRTMEKYMHNCRIISDCESLSRVLPPLKSRCVQIRVGAPKVEEIASTLQTIAGYESFELSDALAERIAKSCGRNARRAITILQTLRASKSFSSSTKIPRLGFEEIIDGICDMTIKDQSPKQLRLIRNKFNDLLCTGIDAEIIFTLLAKRLMEVVHNSLKLQILYHAVNSDYRCSQGTKAIVHLEAFTAAVMVSYRQSMS
ncbi:unnamed protein product [Moneuplotes crassus]|uniref:Uncharacterized protein n=1 Tax=Euplotes crassus TaxID=5936 RepID=A0AAD1XJS8_EUPCR|nr:unnamed protein product [Moneuplotes crassus]